MPVGNGPGSRRAASWRMRQTRPSHASCSRSRVASGSPISRPAPAAAWIRPTMSSTPASPRTAATWRMSRRERCMCRISRRGWMPRSPSQTVPMSRGGSQSSSRRRSLTGIAAPGGRPTATWCWPSVRTRPTSNDGTSPIRPTRRPSLGCWRTPRPAPRMRPSRSGSSTSPVAGRRSTSMTSTSPRSPGTATRCRSRRSPGTSATCGCGASTRAPDRRALPGRAAMPHGWMSDPACRCISETAPRSGSWTPRTPAAWSSGTGWSRRPTSRSAASRASTRGRWSSARVSTRAASSCGSPAALTGRSRG